MPVNSTKNKSTSGTGGTTAPKVGTIAIASATGGQNNTLNAGDIVTVTVPFSEVVTVTGTPQLSLKIGTTVVQANYASGSNSKILSFKYTILAGQTDIDGISIDKAALALNKGRIVDAAGKAANLTTDAVANNKSFLVDTSAPTVDTVKMSATGGQNQTLNAGDIVTVPFNEDVTVTGRPQLALTIGADVVQANYSSSSKGCNYTILAGQTDIDGISIAGTSALALSGGSIVDAAGNAANLTTVAVANNNNFLVDTNAPTVGTVKMSATGAQNQNRLNVGDFLTVTVPFSEVVTVSTTNGTPQFRLMIGNDDNAVIVVANYDSGSGTNSLSFKYNIVALTRNNKAFTTVDLLLNGGSIVDAAGHAANINYNRAEYNNYYVDTLTPSVKTIAITSATGVQNNTLNAGDIVTVNVYFNEDVIVTGTPQLALTIGTTVVKANYARTNTDSLGFDYTILAGQTDIDGISIAGTSALALNGGSMFDSAGNAANLTTVATNSNFKVDTLAPTVRITDNISATTATGAITYTFTYSEDMTGFDINDVTISAGSKGAFTTISPSSVYTLVISPPAGTGTLTVGVATGAATDLAGNGNTVATNNTQAYAPPLTYIAGQAVIDLGAGYGKLIAPVQVDGNWYYYWDRSGNGSNTGRDATTHDVLDAIFNKDSNGVINSTVRNIDNAYGTTDTYRYGTINGVNLALPTVGGQSSPPYGSDGIGNNQFGTAVSNGATPNGTYNDLLAIWDANNGATIAKTESGVPSGWLSSAYWSATPSANGHATVNSSGKVSDSTNDKSTGYVALQLVSGTVGDIVDIVAPTASVITAVITNTGNASVKSSEVGTAYLVKTTLAQPTTLAALTALEANNDRSVNHVSINTANTNTDLAATGLIAGTYKVYTADTAGNLSVVSNSAVTIVADGLIGTRYDGYFADNFTFFNTAISQPNANFETNPFIAITSATAGTNYDDTFSAQWLGYFKASTTGEYTFSTTSDDSSWLWLGNASESTEALLARRSDANELVDNHGIHAARTQSGNITLTANQLYPILVYYGDNSGGDVITVSFKPPVGIVTTDGFGFYYMSQ